MKLLDNPGRPWWAALAGPAGDSHGCCALGAVQMVAYLLLAAPFLLGIGLAYRAFWSGRDLNGLIVLKPPTFWLGAGVAGGLGAVYAVLGTLVVCDLFCRARPALTSRQSRSAGHSDRASSRTRGRVVSLTGSLLLWFGARRE